MTDAPVSSHAEPHAAPEVPPWTAPLQRNLARVDAHRRVLMAGLVVLYVASFNGQWRVSADSALYAALGRSLVEGGGYTYQGDHHTWAEPGLPWLIAAGFRAAGVGTFWPTMVVMLLLAGAALALTYRLFNRRDGRAVAVGVVLLVGVCETFYRYAYHLFTDMPFLVGVLLALNGYDVAVVGRGDRRHRPVPGWFMFATGAALMVALRPVAVTFFASVVAAAAWGAYRGRGRGWGRHAVALAVIGAVVFSFRFVDPRRIAPTGAADPAAVTYPEAQLKLLVENLAFTAKRAVTEHVPKLLEESTPEAVFGLKLAPGLNTILSIAVLAAGVWLVRVEPLWGVYVAATVAQQVIFPPRERYFLPVLPLLLYGGLRLGAWMLRPSQTAAGPARPGGLTAVRRGAAVALGGLFLVANVAYDVAMIAEQRRVPFLPNLDRGQYWPWVKLGEHVDDVVGEHDLVLVPEESRVVHYFSRRRTAEPVVPEDDRPRQKKVVEEFNQDVATARRLWVVLPVREPRPGSGEEHRTRLLRQYVEIGGYKVEDSIYRTGDGRWDVTLHPLVRQAAPVPATARTLGSGTH